MTQFLQKIAKKIAKKIKTQTNNRSKNLYIKGDLRDILTKMQCADFGPCFNQTKCTSLHETTGEIWT